jgi:hypothetical protein
MIGRVCIWLKGRTVTVTAVTSPKQKDQLYDVLAASQSANLR